MKKWIKPQLFILSRSQSAESVLIICKTAEELGSSASALDEYLGCRHECNSCSMFAAS